MILNDLSHFYYFQRAGENNHLTFSFCIQPFYQGTQVIISMLTQPWKTHKSMRINKYAVSTDELICHLFIHNFFSISTFFLTQVLMGCVFLAVCSSVSQWQIWVCILWVVNKPLWLSQMQVSGLIDRANRPGGGAGQPSGITHFLPEEAAKHCFSAN